MPRTAPSAEIALDELFERYLARQINRGRHPKTIQSFDRAATLFQSWLDSRRLAAAEVTIDDLEEYHRPDRFPYAASTRRLYIVQLRAAYRFAHRRGLLHADPFADFEMPRLAAPDPETLSNDELRAIRGRCRSWKHEALFHLLAYTGMRKEEIRVLCWENINRDMMMIAVVGKARKRRHVPIHPALLNMLDRWAQPNNVSPTDLKRGPVLRTVRGGSYAAIGASFANLLERITDNSFHIFRRTVGTSLYRNGVAGDTIDKILGWAAPSIRARYYLDVRPDDLHRAILRLYADSPLS
jgi:integrase